MRDHSRTHRFHGDIAEHDRPAGSFLNEGETGMRGARGGQGVTRNGVLSLREGRQHVPLVELRRRRAAARTLQDVPGDLRLPGGADYPAIFLRSLITFMLALLLVRLFSSQQPPNDKH
jgi:hypothetical protein